MTPVSRLDHLAYACALSVTGLAMAAVVVVRLVVEAIHAATAPTARCPSTAPEWMNEEADL